MSSDTEKKQETNRDWMLNGRNNPFHEADAPSGAVNSEFHPVVENVISRTVKEKLIEILKKLDREYSDSWRKLAAE